MSALKIIETLGGVLLATLSFAKDSTVTYKVGANHDVAISTTRQYFIQAGYVEDAERTKQCSTEPSPGRLVFRHTGEGNAGISGLSRCVIIDVADAGTATILRVAMTDHLRGGVTLPATYHYDA